MKTEIEESIFKLLEAGAAEIREVPERVTNNEVDKLSCENQPFLYVKQAQNGLNQKATGQS